MTNSKAALRYTLGFIGVVQIVLGLIFIFMPAQFADMLDLEAAPGWALWMFSMFGARALGFGYGMFIAMRDPARHAAWLVAMIGVQAVDWLGTVFYLIDGSVTLMQVSTAPFLPILFIAMLWYYFPREQQASALSKGQPSPSKP